MSKIIIAFILGLLDGMFIHSCIQGSWKSEDRAYGVFIVLGVNAVFVGILIAMI